MFSLLASVSTLAQGTLVSDANAQQTAQKPASATDIQASTIPGYDVVQKVADFGENAAKEALPAAEKAAKSASDAATSAADSLASGTPPSLPSISAPSLPSLPSGSVVPSEEKTNMPSLPTPTISAPTLALPAIPLPGASATPLAAPVAPESKPLTIPDPTAPKTGTVAVPASGAAPTEDKAKENLDNILKEMKILKENRGAAEAVTPKDAVPLPDEYKKMMGTDKDAEEEAEDPDAKFKTQYLPDVIYRKDYDRKNAHLPLSLDGADLERGLFETAEAGNINGVRAVLDTGLISPDVRNTYGNTPLMSAALHGRVDTVRLLLAREANPNLQNNLGLTALHIAAQKGRTDVVKALLAMKADPNLKDSYANTPLMFAAAGKHFATAQALLDGGAVREARFLSELVQNPSQMKAVKHGKPPGDPAAMGETIAESNTTPDGLVVNKPYTPPEPEPPIKPEALTAESATLPPSALQEEGVVKDLYGVPVTPKPETIGKDSASEEAKKAAASAAREAAQKPAENAATPLGTQALPVPATSVPIPLAPATSAPIPNLEPPKTTAESSPSAPAPTTPTPSMKHSLSDPVKAEPVKPIVTETKEEKMPEPPAMPSVGLPDEEPAAPIPALPTKAPATTAPSITAPSLTLPTLEASKPVEPIKPIDTAKPPAETKPILELPPVGETKPQIPSVTPPAASKPKPATPPSDLTLPEMPSFDSFVTPEEKPATPKTPAEPEAPKTETPKAESNELSVPTTDAKKAAIPALTPKEPEKEESTDPAMDAVDKMFKDASGEAKKKEEIPAVGPQIPAELE